MMSDDEKAKIIQQSPSDLRKRVAEGRYDDEHAAYAERVLGLHERGEQMVKALSGSAGRRHWSQGLSHPTALWVAVAALLVAVAALLRP